MTAILTRKPLPQAAKPQSTIKRAILSKQAAIGGAARPYLLSFAGTGIFALVLLAAAPGLLCLTLLPIGAVFGLAADRTRMHWGWHRKGGKAAMRQRARYQGTATMAELARNLPAGQGVPIGTVRSTKW